MTQKEIHVAIDSTLSELITVVSRFEQEQFNVIPYEDSWTAGEVTQHLVLSISGFVELLKGPTQETKRNPIEQIANIKNSLLNFSIKFKSPEFVVPERKDYNKQELLNTLKGLKTELENIIESADLNKTCMLFDLPGMGYLTRQEALAFVLYHTKRHIHQLWTIGKALVPPHRIVVTSPH